MIWLAFWKLGNGYIRPQRWQLEGIRIPETIWEKEHAPNRREQTVDCVRESTAQEEAYAENAC